MKAGEYSYISDKITGPVISKEEYKRKAEAWSIKVLLASRDNARKFGKGKGTPGQPKDPHTYKKGKKRGQKEYKLSKQGNNGMFFKMSLDKTGEYEGTGFKMPIHGIFRAWGVGNGQPRTPGKRIHLGKNPIIRTPSNWFDENIDKNAEKLADIAAEYYGDKMIVNTFGVKIKKI
jgi:hypothetical protein